MLEGPNLVLAPLREEDSPLLFKWINDRELVQLSAPFRPISRADHERWFREIREREDVAIFGIRLGEEDRLIGSCQLREIDHGRGSCELQIRIGESGGRDRGHGTEAVRLLLRHAFEDLGLRRVGLEVFDTNRRAIRSYEKAGFDRIRVVPAGALIEGNAVDLVEMEARASELDDD